MPDQLSDDSYIADLPLWSDVKANAVLTDVCATHGVPIEVITELVSLQRERQHQERAAGVYGRIEEILGSMD